MRNAIYCLNFRDKGEFHFFNWKIYLPDQFDWFKVSFVQVLSNFILSYTRRPHLTLLNAEALLFHVEEEAVISFRSHRIKTGLLFQQFK